MPKEQKNIIRKSISDAQLKSELKDLFSKGFTQKTNAYEQIRTKFKMTKQRFWKMFAAVHSEWALLKDTSENEGIQSSYKEAAKNGLKSKIDKLLIMQQEIDNINNQLTGVSEFSFVLGNKILKSHTKGVFRLPVQVQNELRGRKLQYIAEMNKMEGDYAPAKNEHFFPSGGLKIGYATDEG